MSKKPETLLKERFQAAMEKIPGVWCEKIQQVGIRGTPDCLLCVRGAFVAVELKRDEKEAPDPLQVYKLLRIAKCGGMSVTCYPQNFDAVVAKIKELAEELD